MVAIELAHELDALGHDNRVVALALATDGGTDPELPPLVPTVSLRPDVRAACSWQLRRLIERTPVDVILAHGGLPAQLATLGLPGRRPTVVWQRILGFPPQFWQPARRRLWQAIAARVDAAVALTAEEEEELRQLGFAGPVWVIPNFRRPERFQLDRAEAARRLRHEIGADSSAPVIGFVGHLVHQKRPERAVEVLAAVHARFDTARLVMAGDGPLREVVEGEARRLGVEGHLTMLGHTDEVERVYAGVDLLVLTSDVEGMPGVAIEAAMAGCPVVSFPVGGVDHVVRHGASGIVLEAFDTSAMADEVADLLADREVLDRMGAAARERSAEFTAGRTASLYADRLAEIHAHGPVNVAGPRARALRRSRPVPTALRAPNLFLIGAPRAGTTYLYQGLRRAQNLYMSPVKETGFFLSSRHYRLGVDHYLDAYFSGAERYRLRGEATPWYLYSDDARERIAALDLPEAPKCVVLVRQPSERARSMYLDEWRVGSETRPFGEAVDSELALLARGELEPELRKRYVWCGLYADHIETWRKAFGPQSVHVIVFEEFVGDPAGAWSDLAAFLGVDLGPAPFAQLRQRDLNAAAELRWPRLDQAIRAIEGRQTTAVEGARRVIPRAAHRRVVQQVGRYNRGRSLDRGPASDSKAIRDLDDFFRAETDKMADMLGRQLPSWHGSARDSSSRGA